VLNSPLEADLTGGDIDGAVVEADHSTESRVGEPSQASLSESSDSRQANEHGSRFDRHMPTNQSPILSHDPNVGPAQPAEHVNSGRCAGATDGSAAVETSGAPATLDARLFEAAIGSLELLSVHLGRRLGLYDALSQAGEVTVDDLAIRAAIAPRYAREWLEQQAVAGFVTVDDPDADAAIRRFRLSDEQHAVFVEPEHPAHISPVADMIAGIAGALDDVADAYRRGTGVGYGDYGLHLRHGQGGINRPAYTTALADWLDATEIGPRLHDAGSGARIADVGCGQGWSTIALAAAYPQADIVGFDDDTASIDDARLHAAAAGVDVTFEALPATAVADHGPFDAVIVLETLHDLAQPVDALLAWRRALARGGAVVIADEKVADRFTAPGDKTERFMYGFSVLHCLPSSMAAPDSAALGTVLRAATVHELAATAGFGRCAEIDVDAGFFRIYELTP
jgi:SAM-dependent methyltransferase